MGERRRSGEFVASGALLAATVPDGVPHCYQFVSGDFDVYAQLKTSAGGATAKYALLSAANQLASPPRDCITIGIQDDGSPVFIRQDYVNSVLTETAGAALPSSDLWVYVRLRRVGPRFRTFYCVSTDAPTEEVEWSEIAAPASPYSNANPVRLGPRAYENSGTNGGMRWAWLRNWQG